MRWSRTQVHASKMEFPIRIFNLSEGDWNGFHYPMLGLSILAYHTLRAFTSRPGDARQTQQRANHWEPSSILLHDCGTICGLTCATGTKYFRKRTIILEEDFLDRLYKGGISHRHILLRVWSLIDLVQAYSHPSLPSNLGLSVGIWGSGDPGVWGCVLGFRQIRMFCLDDLRMLYKTTANDSPWGLKKQLRPLISTEKNKTNENGAIYQSWLWHHSQ